MGYNYCGVLLATLVTMCYERDDCDGEIICMVAI